MQRSRANSWLRAIHKMEKAKEEGGTSRHLSDIEEDVGEEPRERLGDEEVALLGDPYERADSKEWAESMLRWDGSAIQPSAIMNDGGNVIADYDDLESSQGVATGGGRGSVHGLTQSGLQLEHVVFLKNRSRKAKEKVQKKIETAKKLKLSWDEMFTPLQDFMTAKDMILSNWINVMLLALPLGIASHYLAWPAMMVFIFNLIAVIPLALILGEITEDLAIRFGDVWGGLINATFGNVVEMILSIVLLQKGLTTVVSTSLIGSILSNLLLVIGCCFFVGGLNFKHQHFSSGASKANTSLLFMSCIAMLLPSMIPYSNDKQDDTKVVKEISHILAIVLTLMYLCYLYFQLVTHNHVFISDTNNRVTQQEEEDEEEELPCYSFLGALLLMTLTTIVVAFCSEYLSDSIEQVSKNSGLSLSFIGMIILPIAGNACEHITAVLVAAKNKMDLAIAVGVGSSIQIAIFVYPFVVLVGWATGVDFTMALNPFDVMVVCISVVLAAFITMDGQSHWFTGLMLIATYVLIGVAYFF